MVSEAQRNEMHDQKPVEIREFRGSCVNNVPKGHTVESESRDDRNEVRLQRPSAGKR